MLETIREFASELSAGQAEDEVRDSHAGYYLALAESSDTQVAAPARPRL